MTRMKDRIYSAIASKAGKRMTRDERIVRVLLGTKLENIPERLLLVATTFVMTKVTSKLKRVKVSGKVTKGTYNDIEVGVVDTGIGTPSTAMIVEGLVRTQPHLLIRTDFCGGLLDNQAVGNAFVADDAIIGDGCSAVYFESEKKVKSHKELTNFVVASAKTAGLTVHRGTMWTTDVLLKQTKPLLESWIQKGASAVDMETTAILGISADEGIPAASLNCISDLPAKGKGPFDIEGVSPELLTGLNLTIETGLNALIRWEID
jgi:uridine phosphorylase